VSQSDSLSNLSLDDLLAIAKDKTQKVTYDNLTIVDEWLIDIGFLEINTLETILYPAVGLLKHFSAWYETKYKTSYRRIHKRNLIFDASLLKDRQRKRYMFDNNHRPWGIYIPVGLFKEVNIKEIKGFIKWQEQIKLSARSLKKQRKNRKLSQKET